MSDIVNGENLKKAADIVIDMGDVMDLSQLRDGSVIWAKTECIDELFDKLRDDNGKYTLITHCADHAIHKDVFMKKPACITKWYAQNVDYKHPDLIPVPIGFENHNGRYIGGYTDFNVVNDEAFDFEQKDKLIKKIYCNVRDTHFNRKNIREVLINSGKAVVDSCNTYTEYVKKIKEFLFIASPRGNGIDCHRTWEALYFGSIPMVERHFMYDSYNLPIIQVDNWNNLPIELMNEYIDKYRNKQCFADIKALSMNYWIEKIRQGV